jgi:hypothetical protein
MAQFHGIGFESVCGGKFGENGLSTFVVPQNIALKSHIYHIVNPKQKKQKLNHDKTSHSANSRQWLSRQTISFRAFILGALLQEFRCGSGWAVVVADYLILVIASVPSRSAQPAEGERPSRIWSRIYLRRCEASSSPNG